MLGRQRKLLLAAVNAEQVGLGFRTEKQGAYLLLKGSSKSAQHFMCGTGKEVYHCGAGGDREEEGI